MTSSASNQEVSYDKQYYIIFMTSWSRASYTIMPVFFCFLFCFFFRGRGGEVVVCSLVWSSEYHICRDKLFTKYFCFVHRFARTKDQWKTSLSKIPHLKSFSEKIVLCYMTVVRGYVRTHVVRPLGVIGFSRPKYYVSRVRKKEKFLASRAKKVRNISKQFPPKCIILIISFTIL